MIMLWPYNIAQLTYVLD